jgi:hypothetical protein
MENQCWRVVVKHRRESGRIGAFKSKLMSFTDARCAMLDYERTGHDVQLECDEELAAKHRRIIAADKADRLACERGLA